MINPLFNARALNEPGRDRAEEIAAAFTLLVDTLKIYCPPGREFSLVQTKLEEACFYAKKSMASDPKNQGGE